MLSRRTFLSSIAAAGAGFCGAKAAETADAMVKFGVLSDSHVTADPETAEPLRRIFRHMSEEGVDAVLHCGDICEAGTLAELEHVAAAWREAFPGGKNAKGRPAVPFFVFGNHDYHAASYVRGKEVTDRDRAEGILYNKDKAWRMLTGEPFPGEVFEKTINGIRFVGAHWKHEQEVLELFAKNPPDGAKPFFYVQHPHPGNTCFGPWVAAAGLPAKELVKYGNAFSFSGHSHTTVSDDRAIWQGGFVSMGAGSARLVSTGRRPGCENAGLKPWPKGIVRHMLEVKGGAAWQASIVTVWPDRVEVARRDYKYGETIGEPWVLDFPFRHDPDAPFAVADAARAPQFPADAKISVRERTGTRRPDKASEKQAYLTFPAAIGDGPHARVFYYRTEVLDGNGKTLLERKTVQPCVSTAESRTMKSPGDCAFALEELPDDAPVRFRVHPQNTSGKEGRPLVSEPFVFRRGKESPSAQDAQGKAL